MNIRLAEKKDVSALIDLLKQVGQVHHEIRPDLFRSGAQKYDEAALEELLDSHAHGASLVLEIYRDGAYQTLSAFFVIPEE